MGETGLPEMKRIGSRFVFKRAPRATLTLKNLFSEQVGRTVVDKTGLSGRYEFTLEYGLERAAGARSEEREPTPNPDCLPSVLLLYRRYWFSKLESQKGPVEFIVVDHAQKLSGN